MAEKIDNHIIMAIHITQRTKNVPDVQKSLTDYGCFIKTRLGLHETSKDFCSSSGIVILEMLDDADKADQLLDNLNAIEGVEAKLITFSHK